MSNPSYPLPAPPREPYRRERDPSWDRDVGPPPRDGRGEFRERGGYDERERESRGREFPRRDLDPEPERWGRFDDYDRPKRRRSPSPYNRPLRARHSPPPSPPSHHHPNPYPTTQYHDEGPPDPASLDHLLTFRQFADWFRFSHPATAKADEEELRRVKMLDEGGSSERVGMGKRFERYRKEFYSRQLYALYLTHKQSAWFIERYSPLPEYETLRRRINRQGRLPTSDKYVKELKEGVHDDVSYEQTGDEKPKASEPEGLDRALGERGDKYEDHSDENKVEIRPGGGQVFVKTVPPGTKRVDLEALFTTIPGFQHLALSEPSVKKSFHRVAWAQFAEDVDLNEVVRKVDGQKIDNFTFHLGVNNSATIGRLRITPPAANTLERLLVDGVKAKQLALKLEDDLVSPNAEENGDAEGGVEGGEKSDLEERGSSAVQECVDRLLFAQGLSDEESLDDSSKLRRAKIVLDQWLNYLRLGLSTCYYCVASVAFPEELHRKCIAHVRPFPQPIDTELDTKFQEPPIMDIAKPEISDQPLPENGDGDGDDNGPGEEGDEESRERREERDEKDSRALGDDITRDGGRDDRSPKKGGRKFQPKSVDERWLENLEHRLRGVLEDGVDVGEYGGRDAEEEMRKLCAPLIKQEEPSKYRCKDCNKLFRAPEFVLKHVQVKHPEVFKSKVDDILMLNNFVLDPHHTPVSTTTPAAVNDEILPPPSNPFPPFPFDTSSQGAYNPLIIQQQAMMMMQMQQAMMMAAGGVPPIGGNGNGQPGRNGATSGNLLARVGEFAGSPAGAIGGGGGAPAAGGREDPRARKGRVSYQDLDQVGGGGDGGLPY